MVAKTSFKYSEIGFIGSAHVDGRNAEAVVIY